jgi:poly-gamma-glutamate synthesis protein (capsule biosynthesis protein)
MKPNIDKDEYMEIVIGGDVCPIERNHSIFIDGDATKIFNDLLPEIKGSDFVVINLECPLIKTNAPINKSGPVLGADSDCINGLVNASIDAVNLANNHIMDHGSSGLKNTIEVCRENGILTVGAGENIIDAKKILYYSKGQIRLGILSVAEYEFSIATESQWGANPLDLIDIVRNINNNRKNIDFLIVLLHGGNERYPYPSPRLQDTCRFLIEEGAGAVIVQHTHCAGCYEKYNGKYIVYGQGNLIFDFPRSEKAFYQGFLVKLKIKKDFTAQMDLIPYNQSEHHAGARKMVYEEAQEFLKMIDDRSKSILDPSFVMSQWLEFCKSKKNEYLSYLIGQNKIFKRLDRYGFMVKYFYAQKLKTSIRNIIMCEAHRNVLETIFENKLL